MSGIRVSLGCTSLATGPSDPSSFFQYLWSEWIQNLLYETLAHPAYRQVLSEYLRASASDGIKDGSWSIENGKAWFSFPDYGGTCIMSMQAAAHFVEATVAVYLLAPDGAFDEVMRDNGWIVTTERNPKDVVTTSASPLVILRDALFVVESDGDRISLVTDDGVSDLTFDALTPDEEILVRAALLEQKCGCAFCAGLERV